MGYSPATDSNIQVCRYIYILYCTIENYILYISLPRLILVLTTVLDRTTHMSLWC
jgi:hypothetical protein